MHVVGLKLYPFYKINSYLIESYTNDIFCVFVSKLTLYINNLEY